MDTTDIDKSQRPVIAITMGDAAGVGPEVLARALSDTEFLNTCIPVLIGNLAIMKKAALLVDVKIKWHPLDRPDDIKGGVVNILNLDNIKLEEFRPGTLSADCGRASMEYITEAADLALSHKVDAMVTAPINKKATTLGGYRDIGHLEYLARLSRAKQYATMLVSGLLRTVHLTTHQSLTKACTMVTEERILERLRLTDESFKNWGYIRPCIGVAALNPHGGEDGLMGMEEIDEIIPAVKEAQSVGIDARGPYPADSIFNRAINGEFDVVLAMYHDQGHIPVKVHGFEKSVSVALGLPFIRTSVDHGTAYDIAWQGKADSRSMEESIRMAVSLSLKRRLI